MPTLVIQFFLWVVFLIKFAEASDPREKNERPPESSSRFRSLPTAFNGFQFSAPLSSDASTSFVPFTTPQTPNAFFAFGGSSSIQTSNSKEVKGAEHHDSPLTSSLASDFESLSLFTSSPFEEEKDQKISPINFTATWDGLSDEVQLHILQYLPNSNKHFLTYRLVSRKFNNLLHSIPCSLSLQLSSITPEHLDNLSNLLKLRIEKLSMHHFNDNLYIFDHLRTQLRHLKTLDLRHSPKITIHMFYYISKLSTLENLILEGPQINDNILMYLKAFPALKSLTVRNANLSQKLFEALKDNKNLKGLAYSLMTRPLQITIDEGLSYIGCFPQLTKLDLSGYRLSATGLQHLAKASSLTTLCLQNTDINDQGLDYIGTLPLRHLDLSSTQISCHGLRQRVSLRMFSTLEFLILNNIQIGNLKLSTLVGPLRNLREIYLKNTGYNSAHLLQYYEDITGIKQSEIASCIVMMVPKKPVHSSTSLLNELLEKPDPKSVLLQTTPTTPEMLKSFYEQNMPYGVKIFI